MARTLHRIARRPLPRAGGGAPQLGLIAVPEVCGPPDRDRSGRSVPAEDPSGEGIAVQGHHLRAARSLLDWPLHRLAEAGALSVATVRRLEEGTAGASRRSCYKAVAALHAGGVRFVLIDGSVVAVALADDLAAAGLEP